MMKLSTDLNDGKLSVSVKSEFDLGVFIGEHVLCTLDSSRNRKISVYRWVVSQLNDDGQFCKTYYDIVRETGISYSTVAMTMKALIDSSVFIRAGKVLQLNPVLLVNVDCVEYKFDYSSEENIG